MPSGRSSTDPLVVVCGLRPLLLIFVLMSVHELQVLMHLIPCFKLFSLQRDTSFLLTQSIRLCLLQFGENGLVFTWGLGPHTASFLGRTVHVRYSACFFHMSLLFPWIYGVSSGSLSLCSGLFALLPFGVGDLGFASIRRTRDH